MEHTADVGIHSWGRSLEEAFEQAAQGLAEVLGAEASGPGAARTVRATGDDDGALLVDLLNELLLLHETERVAFARIAIERIGAGELEARVEVVPLSRALEGASVKAATFHQLRVERDRDGRAEVRVYLDV